MATTTTTITTSDPPTSAPSSKNFDWSNNYPALDPILNNYIRFWFGRGPYELRDSIVGNGETPLMEAIRNGDEASVFMMLLFDRHVYNNCSSGSDKGGNGTMLVIGNADGRTALHIAASEGRCHIMTLLLEHIRVTMSSKKEEDFNKSNYVNRKDKYGCTALSYAVRVHPERTNLVRLLLEQGNPDITCVNKAGELAIFSPAILGHVNVLRLLLDYGGNKMLQYQNEQSKEDMEIVMGRDSEKGDTVLHVAAACGRHNSIVALLRPSSSVIAAGVAREKDGRDGSDGTDFHQGRSGSSSPPSSTTNTIPVNIGNDLGETPLHKAAQRGYYKAVRTLLLFGSNINCRTKKGLTPLHCACGSRIFGDDDNNNNYDQNNDGISMKLKPTSSREVVSRLLQHGGADIHAVDRGGRTPLHYAAKRGRDDLVRLLINKGADIHVQDNYGYTPLQLASPRRNKNRNVIRLLSSLGAT